MQVVVILREASQKVPEGISNYWNRLEGSCYNFCTQLHKYASSDTGYTSSCKNCSIATAADYHVTVGWNAIAKATANV